MREMLTLSQADAKKHLVPLIEAVSKPGSAMRTPFLIPSGIAMPECDSIVAHYTYSAATDSPPGLGNVYLFDRSTDSTGD